MSEKENKIDEKELNEVSGGKYPTFAGLNYPIGNGIQAGNFFINSAKENEDQINLGTRTYVEK